MLMYFSARSSSDLLKSLSCIFDIQFSQNLTLNPNSWFIIHYMEWQRCTHPLIHKYILHCNLRQSFGSNSSHWIQFSFDAQRGSPRKKKSWKNSISSFCKWMPHAFDYSVWNPFVHTCKAPIICSILCFKSVFNKEKRLTPDRIQSRVKDSEGWCS